VNSWSERHGVPGWCVHANNAKLDEDLPLPPAVSLGKQKGGSYFSLLQVQESTFDSIN